jgi:outer membrane immunogenic protein
MSLARHHEVSILIAGMVGAGRYTSGVEVGWTAGGGAEFAVSRKMTIRGEYLYYDLGDTDFRVPGALTAGFGNLNATAENKGHIARAALSVKF